MKGVVIVKTIKKKYPACEKNTQRHFAKMGNKRVFFQLPIIHWVVKLAQHAQWDQMNECNPCNL